MYLRLQVISRDGFSKKLLDRWKAGEIIREKKSRNYYLVKLRSGTKVRTDIVHVGDIKQQYKREQDQMPQKENAAV